ncbi:MAG TPA: hypothetical protein VF524_04655 [Polyangia bacterium]
MSSNESKPGHKKIVEFIPYKTMAMDLESILASLTRMYVSRNNIDMVELITLCQPELFPVGSFDPEGERYEYVLKLAVPVKFHNHLRDNIDKIQPQLLADIATVTAPYLHEFISEVFVALKIEQDLGWRDAAMDWVMEGSGQNAKKETDILLMHAPGDEAGMARELKAAFEKRNIRVARHSLVSVKDKDIHHALTEFEKRSHFGVFVVSPAMTRLPFSQETLDRIVGYLMNPGKKLCQIWDKIERTDVANFSPALARSLAFTTERMTVEQVCGLLMKSANLG